MNSGKSIAAWLWALILLPTLPLLGAAGYSAYQYAQERGQLLELRLVDQAVNLSAQVNTDLEHAAGLLFAMAQSDAARSGDTAALYAYAKRVQAASSFLVAISLADREGNLEFLTMRPLGTVLKAVDPASVRETFATAKPSLSSLVRSPISDRLAIILNMPIVVEGRVIYCLRGVIELSSLSKRIEIAHPLPGMTSEVVTDSGIVLARSAAHEQYVGKPAAPALRQAIKANTRTVWAGESLQGEAVSVASRPVGSWGLTVAVSLPADLLLAPLRRELAEFATLSAAILVLLAWTVAVVNRHISRALAGVAMNAQMTLNGTIANPKTTYIQELDDLQDSLVKAEGFRSALLQQVEARTAELRAARQRLLEFTQKLQDEVERERLRIAREVHDQIGAVITGVSMLLSGRTAAALPEDKRQVLHAALDQGLATVRRITAELRPPLLDDLGLQAAVQEMATALLQPQGIACRVNLEGSECLTPRQTIGCFRIIQEAVTNVLRHSACHACEITGRVVDGTTYVVEITDDGVGLPGALDLEGHFGVVGMRERAHLMEGALRIGNRSGRGCMVSLSIPIFVGQEDSSDVD